MAARRHRGPHQLGWPATLTLARNWLSPGPRGRPAEPWTLDALDRHAGNAHSKLAERFHRFTEESPMRYLARWRMQLASNLLEHPGASIAQIAEQVGYGSEAAFKRAFKKHVGDSPGSWRRSR